eukprot:scaffold33596_cov115-Skeletonema_dohrnii-CCMP3373.AAC.4
MLVMIARKDEATWFVSSFRILWRCDNTHPSLLQNESEYYTKELVHDVYYDSKPNSGNLLPLTRTEVVLSLIYR